MIPRFEAGGQLPLGRFSCSLAEAEARFVAEAESDPPGNRAELWSHFVQVTNALRDATGVVNAAWLGGGFTEEKPNPDDIDVVYIVDSAAVLRAKRSEEASQTVALVAGNMVKSAGLRLDTFIMPWRVSPDSVRDEVGSRRDRYLADRGYWDDHWHRVRSGPRGSVNDRQSALPRRGYLEVVVDGYS